MQRYGDSSRTEQQAFSVIELMTYCFSIFFKENLTFLQYPKVDNQKVIIKSPRLRIFFSNWIWNLNILFYIKEVSFKLIQKHISLVQLSFGENYKIFVGLSFSKNIFLRKTVLLSIIFISPSFHCLSLFYNLSNCSQRHVEGFH